jgi:molybdopterin synthase sulfur carrier subunit
MVVTVRFIGPLRSILGKSKLGIEHENAISLRKALDKIVEELPQIKQALFDPELEDPRPNVLILVNGKEIGVLNGLETILKNGDEVVFVPVIHGG